jgi:hypothetical protein
VRGASHDRDGKPNQDAVRVVQVTGSTPGLVAAVCDGHGGDRYVRSDIGSRLAVEVACEVGKRALEDLGPLASPSAVEARLAGPVAQSIVERWRERVLDDVKSRAFTDEERARAGVSLDGDPLISYGATLLLAILAPTWVGLLQIGDGDVTVVRGALAESPVPDDDRLIGGETTSLCLPTAVADARVCVLVEPLPEMLILTTDGYANSFASPTWRTDAGTDLRNHVQRLGMDAVEKRLPSWLADSATAGGDDVSMALIQRADAVGVGVAGSAPGAARSAPSNAMTSPVTRSPAAPQRRGLIPIALAAVALAGGVGGWILGRSGSSVADSATAVVLVSTSVAPTISPTTSTVAPSTTVLQPRPGTPALSDGHTPQLLLGETRGLALSFDSTLANPQDPQFLGWVEFPVPPAPLEPPWALKGGYLYWDTECLQAALVALRQGSYLRAVGPDGKIMTSYAFDTGDHATQALIVGGLDSGVSTSADPACSPVSQGTVGGSGTETTTTQGN